MPTNDPIAEDMERAYRDLDAENTEAQATIDRLREENEQADRLVSEYRERQTEAERKLDKALALLAEIEDFWSCAPTVPAELYRAIRKLLAGDRQEVE